MAAGTLVQGFWFLVSGPAVLINTPSKLQTTPSLSTSAMRPPWFLLSVIIVIHSAVDVTAGKERRSNVNGRSATILTPDVVQAVQEVVDSEAVGGGSLFNLASCSKAFLSASLGIVIDDFAYGRNTTPLPAGLLNLTWKTKVADILPNDWQLMDPWASQKANLIDILSHVSGVAR